MDKEIIKKESIYKMIYEKDLRGIFCEKKRRGILIKKRNESLSWILSILFLILIVFFFLKIKTKLSSYYMIFLSSVNADWLLLCH